MRRFGKTALYCSGAAIAATLIQPAAAQTSAPTGSQVSAAPDPSPTPADSDEIVVTAQRRTQRLEDVPMSITALTAETVERSGITNITELGAITPGVQVNFAGGATQPAIRGITSLTNYIGAENNVAIYVDGFYTPDMTTVNADFANIQGIEILKGPQGTLYGRNATGGAILITTRAPTNQFHGRIEGTYSTFDDRSLSGYLSGPIIDGLRFSVAGYDRRSDGYIRFSNPTQVGGPTQGDAARLRQRSVRLRLDADLASNLTATLGYNYGLSDDPRGNLFTTYAHIPATVPAPPQRATDPFQRSYNFDTANLGTTDEGTLRLAWRTGIGTLTSYTSYGYRFTKQNFDFDGTYVDRGSNQQQFGQRTFQESADFAINAVHDLDLVVGGSYYHDVTGTHGSVQRLTLGVGQVPLSRILLDLRTRAFAIYADATYHLTPSFSVDLGGRYSEEHKEITLEVTGTGAYPQFTRDATFRRFTPRAAIRYEVAPRTSVYASFAQGFRSGNFPTSGAPATIEPIRPEIVTAYEVGLHTARPHLRFDIAAYYYNDKDLHVSVTVPVVIGNTTSTQVRIANASRAEIYGADGQLTWTPVERLNLRVGAAYLHGRYTDFPNAVGTGLNAVTNVNVGNQFQSWNGQQTARSPTFTANLGADYTVAVAGGQLQLSGNYNYTDSYVINNASLFGPLAGPGLANQQRYRQGAYSLLNLEANWTDPSGRVTVGIFGRNVTDKYYLMVYSGGANGDYFTPATPRQIGGRVRFQF